jgi:hypothetical protein
MPSQITASRARGWKKTIHGVPAILDLAPDVEDDDDQPVEVREKMVALLKAHNVPEEIVEEFEYCTHVFEFNEAMDTLYDWADEQRVWIDPTR